MSLPFISLCILSLTYLYSFHTTTVVKVVLFILPFLIFFNSQLLLGLPAILFLRFYYFVL